MIVYCLLLRTKARKDEFQALFVGQRSFAVNATINGRYSSLAKVIIAAFASFFVEEACVYGVVNAPRRLAADWFTPRSCSASNESVTATVTMATRDDQSRLEYSNFRNGDPRAEKI